MHAIMIGSHVNSYGFLSFVFNLHVKSNGFCTMAIGNHVNPYGVLSSVFTFIVKNNIK